MQGGRGGGGGGGGGGTGPPELEVGSYSCLTTQQRVVG